MARGAVFIKINKELFDVFAIKSIRRFEIFDMDNDRMDYGIIINEEVHSDAPFRDVKFKYKTFEERETTLMDIEKRLVDFEFIMII